MGIEIDESFVDAAAPNANAIKNGRGLVFKSKFVQLNQSQDGSIIFGECSGSGKSNYHCSADFVQPDAPIYRCSCPSRQFPCKHCLGLMYAFVQESKFTAADIPSSITEKRDKAEARATKKAAKAKEPAKPKRVNKAALKKKLGTQLDGLDLLETLILDLTRTGLGSLNAKTASQIEDQARQLGNAYLPGAQAALYEFTGLFTGNLQWWELQYADDNETAIDRDKIYSEALDRLNRVHSLVKQGRTYLKARLEDPELKPATDNAIAAWLGHAWQLTELRDAGLVLETEELIQLAFHCIDSTARREFIDTGFWINLKSGAIQLTQNFRPYRAAKYIKEEDSFFSVAQTPNLYIYPGDLNPRVRWEEMTFRATTKPDFKTIRAHGSDDLTETLKLIKNQLKSPLANKQPLALVNFSQIGQVEDQLILEDKQGARISLRESIHRDVPGMLHLLPMLPAKSLKDQTVLLRFHHQLDKQILAAEPLSIITSDEVIRLTY